MDWICQVIMSCGDIGMAVIVLGGSLGLLVAFTALACWLLGEGKEEDDG